MYSTRHYQRSKNTRTNSRGYYVLSKGLGYLKLILVALFVFLLIARVASAQDASATIDGTGGDISVVVDVKPWPQTLMQLMADTFSFLVAVIENPMGAINAGLNTVTDLIAGVLPSTPSHLKLSSIASNLGENVPLVGTAVIRAVLNTFIELGGLALVKPHPHRDLEFFNSFLRCYNLYLARFVGA